MTCPSSSSGIVAIPGFYEKPRPFTCRFEVEDLVRSGTSQMLQDAVAPALSTIRVAAIQMTAELANVGANLARAERLVRVAFERGANWAILPEFFSSGNAFHPAMAAATRAIDGP